VTTTEAKDKLRSDFDVFNAQAESAFEAQRAADKKAVQRKKELDGAISAASKYYVPKTKNPPQIFKRPSAEYASKDAIAGQIVEAMDHQDKEDAKKVAMDGKKEADMLEDINKKNEQFGDLLHEKS
jgi:hypothetical protein